MTKKFVSLDDFLTTPDDCAIYDSDIIGGSNAFSEPEETWPEPENPAILAGNRDPPQEPEITEETPAIVPETPFIKQFNTTFKPGDKVKSQKGEIFTVSEIDPAYPDIEVIDSEGTAYFADAESFKGVE